MLDTESPLKRFLRRNLVGLAGLCVIAFAAALAAALATWSVTDPSLNHATTEPVRNALGTPGAILSDVLMQSIGLATAVFLVPVVLWGWRLLAGKPMRIAARRILFWFAGTLLAAGAVASLPVPDTWPLPTGLGGFMGDAVHYLPQKLTQNMAPGTAMIIGSIGLGLPAVFLLIAAGGWFGKARADEDDLPLPKQVKGKRTPVQQQLFDDEDDDGEDDTSRFSALMGAAGHWRLQIQSTLQRVTGLGRPSGRNPREAADYYDADEDAEDYEEAPRRRGIGALSRGLVGRLLPGQEDDGLDELYPAEGNRRDTVREHGRPPVTGPRITGSGRHAPDDYDEDETDGYADAGDDADDGYNAAYDDVPFDLDDEDEADARLAHGRDGRGGARDHGRDSAPLDRAPLARPVGIASPAAAPSRGPAARGPAGPAAQGACCNCRSCWCCMQCCCCWAACPSCREACIDACAASCCAGHRRCLPVSSCAATETLRCILASDLMQSSSRYR